MNRQVVFMLEEPSIKAFLEELLRPLFPDADMVFIPHEGKSDLEKSLPRKLKGWRQPADFIVVRDQDGGDCKAVKQRIVDIVTQAGRHDAIVRIACRELEAWFLGDLGAVEIAFEARGVAAQSGVAKFRNPDDLGNPAQVLKGLVPSYQKVSGARAMGKHVVPSRNTSPSFRALFAAVERLLGATKNVSANSEPC